MMLVAFRIQNFQSIVDTTWRQLSPDSITGLIGQNESGKSSILHSLLSFSTGSLTIDNIRSDGSYPEISCAFGIDASIVASITSKWRLPNTVVDYITSRKSIALSREWLDKEVSHVTLPDQELLRLFLEEQKRIAALKEQVESFKNMVLARHVEAENELAAMSNEPDKAQGLVEQLQQELKAMGPSHAFAIELTSAETQLQKAKSDLVSAMAKEVEAKKAVASASTPELKKTLQVEVVSARKSVATANATLNDSTKDFEVAHSVMLRAMKVEYLEKQDIEKLRAVYKPSMSPADLATEVYKLIPHFELFQDDASLLPNRIDLQDIIDEDEEVEGYFGVMNFLKVAGISSEFFEQSNQRLLTQRIRQLNNKMSVDFRGFWTQQIGNLEKIEIQLELKNYSDERKEKAGKPYLQFWLVDGRETLHPKQRSAGVRWFLSFYLQLKAYATDNHSNGRVLLIDEPGGRLHARAQEDVLRIFDEIRDRVQIVYTTHSPHLLSPDKVYRLLAIQRDPSDDKSDTKVLTPNELGAATTDTMSPLYTLIGVSFAHQQVIKQKDNILLEEISAYYYLKAFFKLSKIEHQVSFLPATGCTHVPQLANLLMGWGIDFIVVLDDEKSAREAYNTLKEEMFGNNEAEANKKMYKIKDSHGIEDLFTKTDFKNFVIKDEHAEVGERNSQYMKKLSKGITALNFYLAVKKDEITLEMLNRGTQDEITKIVNKIKTMLDGL